MRKHIASSLVTALLAIFALAMTVCASPVNPPMGDESNLSVVMVILIASGALLVIFAEKSRKVKKEKV